MRRIIFYLFFIKGKYFSNMTNFLILQKESFYITCKMIQCCRVDKNINLQIIFVLYWVSKLTEQRRDNRVIANNLFCHRLQFDGHIRDGNSRDS